MDSDIWCLSGELPQSDIDRVGEGIEAIAEELGVFPPTVSSFEQAAGAPWRVEIYFAEKPEPAFVAAILARLNLTNWPHDFAAVEERDWVAESQKLLAPVTAGRFFVFGSHDADKAQDGMVNLLIDAGQAFGTGKHETTSACLEVIDDLAGKIKPQRVLDLGTGTGVLALAAQRVWPDSIVLASDIDPISIEVASENIDINAGVSRPDAAQQAGIALVVAAGLDDPVFKADGPFDLITANILAGPLIDLSADITEALAPGGTLVLSGLLVTQEKEVLAAYEPRGLRTLGRVEKGEWLALTLRKP